MIGRRAHNRSASSPVAPVRTATRSKKCPPSSTTIAASGSCTITHGTSTIETVRNPSSASACPAQRLSCTNTRRARRARSHGHKSHGSAIAMLTIAIGSANEQSSDTPTNAR